MPAVIPIALGVSAAASAAGAAASASAASRQASLASQVANYNANVDISNANQTAANASANIDSQRLNNQSYLSSMRAGYAASGVLDTGSAMVAQATTAGRQEQDIQQYWADTQEQEQTDYEAAQLGVYEGQEESEAYHLEGAGDIFQGIASVANLANSPAGQQVLGTTGSSAGASVAAAGGSTAPGWTGEDTGADVANIA